MKQTERFLSFLEVERKEPSLSYLNELIHAHQTKVKWETLTKFIDYEELSPADSYLPSVEDYIERVIEKRAGGTCYSLARGFRWLLEDLGFQVNYLLMAPGHMCLRVDLDQPYYVDVGYSAPLFKAYPLHQSFTVHAAAETFNYTVKSDREVLVERTPGPTKTLKPEPVGWNEMTKTILKTHDWEDGFAFQTLKLFGYIDGVAISLRNNELRQFKESGIEDQVLSRDEVMMWVKKFGLDTGLYESAVEIYKKRKGNEPY
ncbi:arylamine N-acetyltransferase [Jeotgalibacillus proteolyticus]|uniref:Arylamine N-acetyltransferase n=1 Tax=Jeotgalibacillus proteolyticus TaxID=2082395 RepID=A0A2S5GDJ8_9BACL|nr:arylamine N-acetyltransferase [Jeotgalibacillus proteolyticus]PPA71028.1 hypothetical protein C4B60_09630 [Jeotgalibacillus proteolyticus]